MALRDRLRFRRRLRLRRRRELLLPACRFVTSCRLLLRRRRLRLRRSRFPFFSFRRRLCALEELTSPRFFAFFLARRPLPVLALRRLLPASAFFRPRLELRLNWKSESRRRRLSFAPIPRSSARRHRPDRRGGGAPPRSRRRRGAAQ